MQMKEMVSKLINQSSWALLCICISLIISCAKSHSSSTTHLSAGKTKPIFDPDNVEVMGWQKDNYLWFGNRNGVVRLDIVTQKADIFENVGCGNLLVRRSADEVWCSLGGKTYRFKDEAWAQFDIANGRKIIEDHQGHIWAGNWQGLARFNEAEHKWEQVIEASGIASHFIFSNGGGIALAFQGQDGSFWFASFSEPYVGVTQWTPAQEQTWQPLGKWDIVFPLLEASDGSIWGGTGNGVIARWDQKEWQTWRPFPLEPAIEDLLEAQDGSIWVRATVDGVGRWDGQSWHIWSRDETILQSCPGLAKGKTCFSIPSYVIYHSAEGLGKADSNPPRFSLTTIAETQDGHIWVGTTSEGISRWNGHQWRNYTLADGLSSEAITVLTESPDGILRAGTWGGGVNYYEPESDRWHPFP